MSEQMVHIEGLDEAIAKVGPKLISQPLRDFFQRVLGLGYQGIATERSPVDTGRLKNSLQMGAPNNLFEIDRAEPPLWGKYGTSVNAEGFSYPRHLDESDRTHYRGTQRKGDPTRGWFSGIWDLSEMKSVVKQAMGSFKDEVGRLWSRR